MFFQRYSLSLPFVTLKCPTRKDVLCIASEHTPSGPTKFAHFGRLTAALLIALCALFGAAASAQSAHFAGAMSTLFSGTYYPSGVALDGNGNYYICDENDVYKETLQSDGSYIQSSLAGYGTGATGVWGPTGIAVDTSGNVYVSDYGNNRAVKFTLQSNGSYIQATMPTSQLEAPEGIAVDGSGNVYIADYYDSRVLKETPSGGGYTETAISSGTLSPFGIAVDYNGNNVYIADNNGRVDILSGPSYTVSTIGSGIAQGTSGIAVDVSGNIYVSDTGNDRVLKETLSGGTYTQSIIASAGLVAPKGLAVDFNGNVYIADSSNGGIAKDTLTGWNFGTLAVGTQSPAVTLVFSFDSGGTIDVNVGEPGLGGQEFSDDGTGTCTLNGPGFSYAAGQTCTVNVTFQPQFSGVRYGAANLNIGGMATIAEGYLQGTGSGAQTGFLPAVQNASSSTGLSSPTGIAVDDYSNVYVSNSTSSGQVWQFTMNQAPSAGYSIGTGLSNPAGLAIDGNGNIYIADSANNRVLKETSCVRFICYGQTTIPTSTLNSPEGVAVDGQGNVYIADTDNSRVLKEVLSVGGYAEKSLAGGLLASPQGIAVDGNGNIYIADTGNQQVLKLAPLPNTVNSTDGYEVTTIIPASAGQGAPNGIAVDSNGRVYISFFPSNKILKETPSASGYIQSAVPTSGLSTPSGIAVDPYGNLYIADSGNNRVVEEDIGDAPTLNFASTDQGKTSTDSPQTVTVENTGNAPLNFTDIVYPTDFPEAGSLATDCTTSTPVAVGSTCTFTIDFSPTSTNGSNTSAALSETLYMYNNAKVGEEGFTVTGTETNIAPPAAAPTFLPVPGIYTSAQTVTISDATAGAVIYYTTNNTTPTTSSTKYTGPITVSTSETVQAIAVATSYTSTSAFGRYFINLPGPAATPTFSVASGAYTSVQSVILSDATSGAAIYYTTDGSTPTINSTKYSAAIPVPSSAIINAIAVASGYNNSAVSSATYIINLPQVTAPAFSIAGGTFSSAQTVSISDSTPNATIYYTTDGTPVTTASPKYNGSITVSSTETIQAIAVATGYANSAVTSAAYDINLTQVAAPHFSIGTGTYTSAQTVTLSDVTAGATIYYTTDGTTPTINSNKYSTAITVASNETINAIAVAAGLINSETVWATYTINIPAPDFILNTSTNSALLLQGSTAVFNLTVTPLGAAAFPTGVTLTASGLPAGATATFSPATIASGAGATAVTMTISASTTSSMSQPSGGSAIGRITPFALALLLLPFAGRLRKSGKRLGRLLTVLLLLGAGAVAMTGMSGCGNGSNGFFGLMPKAYPVTVTGVMGTQTHAATVTLIVQ
ncbi:MAG: chitobiase/beta-hexosaminidase C-terminal domain-containing protein [Terracidiphilus sp.]